MDLFISYARVDTYLVKINVVDILRAAGHNPWFDHELVVGHPWKPQLLEQIQACEVFVYTITPESVKSEYCQWEYKKAVELGKPVLPILLQARTELPESLKNIQYVDFTEGATGEAVAKLSRGLFATYQQQLSDLSEVVIDIPQTKVQDITENPSDTPALAYSSEQINDTPRKSVNWSLYGGIVVVIVILIAVSFLFNQLNPPPILSEIPSVTISVSDIPTTISTETASPTATDIPTVTSTPTSTTIGCDISTTESYNAIAGDSGLRMRSKPDISASVVKSIPSGSCVIILTIISTDNPAFSTWVEVYKDGIAGYVWIETFTELSQTKIEFAARDGTIPTLELLRAIAGDSGLRMRSKPDISASIVKDIPSGNSVSVLTLITTDNPAFSTWVEVYKDGIAGYVWIETFTELSQTKIEFAARDSTIPIIKWSE